jgi:ribosomal peptide maturation radical SAM protein 1
MPEPDRSIVLVSMPWAILEFPSIPLGILTGALRRAGIAPVTRPYNLTFVDHLNRTRDASEPPLTVPEYTQLANLSPGVGLADWVFALPPFRALDPDGDNESSNESGNESNDKLLRRLHDTVAVEPRLIECARRLRARVPGFIASCVDDVLRQRPAMVGFTTTFCQNVSSLLLARALKDRDPSLRIVFGGANCDGAMGQALFDAFPWIDVVVQGEGEVVVVELARETLAGREVAPRPGVLARGARPRLLVRRPAATEEPAGEPAQAPGEPIAMDAIPTPDYDFYFEALEACDLRDELLMRVRLPVETARGCWWGQKNHCTFCGLNGSTMAFRSKSVDRALRDFNELVARYRCLDFVAVDNIIDLEYLSKLLPRLRESGVDLDIYYETKANLTKDQVRMMWESGIRRIQPGIESLSTPILRLMKKGVAAWQNVRLLKWAAQFGVGVDWNMLYGFPGEPAGEYARMAAALPALTHLEPPSFVRMRVQRFSPYHQRPGDFGIRLDGPDPHYAQIYPPNVRLDDLAYFFDFTYLDGQRPDDYTGELRQGIADWNRFHDRNRGQLSYRCGPDFIRIVDNREPFGYARYVLEGREAAAYLACDGGTAVAGVCRELARQGYAAPAQDELESFLRELVEARLMFESDGRFVALALPVYAERDAARRGLAQPVAGDAAA